MSDEAPPINRILELVKVETRRPNVAIVGFTDHRLQAPLNDPSYECWGINELYRYMPVERFTRWFEIHDRTDFENSGPQHLGDPEHLKSLASFPIPFYTNAPWEGYPSATALPKAQIEAACGTYMTSSIAWMLGLAIMEGFKKIGIYGVDMAQDTEWAGQRPCCEYLIGLARGRGIEVFIPPTSDLLKAIGQYGFASASSPFSLKAVERSAWLQREHTAIEGKLSGLRAEFEQKKVDLGRQFMNCEEQLKTNLHQLEGAIDDVRYWQRSWGVMSVGEPGKSPTPERPYPKLADAAPAVPGPDGAQPVPSPTVTA